MDSSPALDTRIRELAERLERFSGQITRCHVIIEAPHKHQQQGRLFEARIDITVPGGKSQSAAAGPRARHTKTFTLRYAMRFGPRAGNSKTTSAAGKA